MTTPLIEARDLRLHLGGRDVLAGVSLQVAPGEVLALCGPNGSGKTSVLRCLLGLVPFQGSASIGGHDVQREPLAARSLLGYVPQRAAFGDSTALEVVAFVARLRGLPRQRALDALRDVGLLQHANARARVFSGGMQQRLSLAVALLPDPPALLLDEPTASLDRAGQLELIARLSALRRAGRAVLLTTHRAEEMGKLADRVLELADGAPAAEAELAPVLPLHIAGGAR
jgi:ABC-type multidrug transport system ATPase subunit